MSRTDGAELSYASFKRMLVSVQFQTCQGHPWSRKFKHMLRICYIYSHDASTHPALYEFRPILKTSGKRGSPPGIWWCVILKMASINLSCIILIIRSTFSCFRYNVKTYIFSHVQTFCLGVLNSRLHTRGFCCLYILPIFFIGSYSHGAFRADSFLINTYEGILLSRVSYRFCRIGLFISLQSVSIYHYDTVDLTRTYHHYVSIVFSISIMLVQNSPSMFVSEGTPMAASSCIELFDDAVLTNVRLKNPLLYNLLVWWCFVDGESESYPPNVFWLASLVLVFLFSSFLVFHVVRVLVSVPTEFSLVVPFSGWW